MIKELLNKIRKKKEKIESPDVKAIIKLTEIAKDRGIYDDQNKIIEIHRYGNIKTIKYSDADVESLREQGIPVIEEIYSEDYEFIQASSGGGVDNIK